MANAEGNLGVISHKFLVDYGGHVSINFVSTSLVGKPNRRLPRVALLDIFDTLSGVFCSTPHHVVNVIGGWRGVVYLREKFSLQEEADFGS
jgi:hypothetical protein